MPSFRRFSTSRFCCARLLHWTG